MEGHNLITSKSTAILTATVSNTASHFGGRNDFTGGANPFTGGGAIAPPPRYIVKKDTEKRVSVLDLDPMSLSSEMWMDDIATWPALDLGKIFVFILSKRV